MVCKKLVSTAVACQPGTATLLLGGGVHRLTCSSWVLSRLGHLVCLRVSFSGWALSGILGDERGRFGKILSQYGKRPQPSGVEIQLPVRLWTEREVHQK